MAFDYKKALNSIIFVFAFSLVSFLFPRALSAQENSVSLYLVPAGGTYVVGDTFTVSLYVNTAGETINAIEANLTFPPDKLQVVSPSSGRSVIELWLGQPSYSNSAGTLSFIGAIPNPGLNVSQGLVSTITFRAKQTGRAVIDFSADSKVLLNDGFGTPVLGKKSGAILDLVLPPPQGPTVVSTSHPDQSRWYSVSSVVLSWSGEPTAHAYSFVLDDEPITIPDNTAEGAAESVSFADVADGVHYFHIKARRGNVWGGTTHFVARVDTSPPAQFPITILPSNYTSVDRPIVEFTTTDGDSGVSFYEVKVVGLSAGKDTTADQQPFFVEAASPYLPQLTPGKYEVIVRAHDAAGNVQEAKSNVQVLTPGLGFLGYFNPNILWLFVLVLGFCLVAFYLYRVSRAKTINAIGTIDKGPVQIQ